MDLKYTIKENFLNQTDFENLRNTLLGEKFPWYFSDRVSYPGKHATHFCWNHGFFDDRGIISSAYDTLSPLLKKLKAKVFIRIRANLYSNQGKIIEHENHADFPFKHKGAVFSLNTCNGFTILNNTKIKSIANRLLLFDASQPHNSSTCTDAKVRCNININYF